MAVPLSCLLGPPEIHRQTTTTTTRRVANFNSSDLTSDPPMGYTENLSRTFTSTGNPCLDFFFHVVPDTPASTLTHLLQSAWDHDPLITLKLVCNLRGVRGTGKSDKEGYYTAALWLHNHHPKTLACNVASLADFGCFKDLPEILYRLLEGPDVRRIAKQEWKSRKSGKRRVPVRPGVFRGGLKQKVVKRSPREAGVLEEMKRAEVEKDMASNSRQDKKIAAAKKALERYSRDPDYRFLFDRVSDLFAECLKSDINSLNSGESNKISLAAKWCPSLDSSFDRSTLLCESIARRVFPRESYPEEYEGIEDAHYAYRVRDRLRKQVLVPLRKALELPEVYIGANQWNSIPYDRVASLAMKLYKDKFLKHDKERFEEYLERVKSGKATIAAGALLWHKIIGALNEGDGGQVAELQWKRMVDDTSKKGKLKNCLAVCDVSGSMEGIPMKVSLALGVLVSELSEEPWKGKLITFSHNPKLQIVDGDHLISTIEKIRRMEWGMSSNFQAVIEQIRRMERGMSSNFQAVVDWMLQVAVNKIICEEEMIKRLFVFSDMEFDQASCRPWETDYQTIVRKFREKGCGSAVPEIVFWNLRDSRATPVPSNQKGVALVSGFSKNLMTIFLEEGGDLNPEAVMEAAIAGEEYKKLVVLD